MPKIKIIGNKVVNQEVFTSSVIGYHILIDGRVILLRKIDHKEYEFTLRK